MDKARYVLGGALWINLMNTILNANKRMTDLLSDPVLAVEWLEENGLFKAGLHQDAFLPDLLGELVSVRALCRRILFDVQETGEIAEKQYTELQNRLEKLDLSLTATREPAKVALVYKGRTLADQAVYLILHSLVETLRHHAPERIRKCQNEHCILHFVDTSKSGKRRWCSMEYCGNRHKAAQFYENKRMKK